MTNAILTFAPAIPIEEFLTHASKGRFEYINGEWLDIFTQGSDTSRFIEGDDSVLTGAPLLPQFELPLSQLFAE